MSKDIENIDSLEDFENLEKELNEDKIVDEELSKDDIGFSSNQEGILKEIGKIDLEIEQLKSSAVNEDEFYDNLDSLLSDEEKYLAEEDSKAYLKLIDKKKKEFFESKSNDKKIEELEEQKRDLELQNQIEIGLKAVTKLYKDYNHDDMEIFFKRKLNQDERDEILQNSKTTFDVFKMTYEKYLEKNGKKLEVKSVEAPNIPNMNKIIKESIKDRNIDMIDSEDEKYKKALGVG